MPGLQLLQFSEFLREKQQGGGGKIAPPPPRLGLNKRRLHLNSKESAVLDDTLINHLSIIFH